MIACGIRKNDHASLEVCVPTALPQHMRAKIREVKSFHTDPEHRGKGFGKDLLTRLIISADLSDTWLMLHVEPDDEADKPRLANLYASFGFKPFQAEPLLMIRPSVHAKLPV